MIQRFPEAVGHLERGRLSMTTLVALEGVLRPENAGEIFETAAGKSKREVEYLVACLQEPEAPVAESVRKLPPLRSITFEVPPSQPPPVISALPIATSADVDAHPPDVRANTSELSGVVRSIHRVQPLEGTVAPTGVDRYRITLTVDAEFKSLLEQATTILDHVEPSGNMVAILRKGLEKVVKAHEAKVASKKPRTKRKSVEKPAMDSDESVRVGRKNLKIPSSGRIPADVRKEVWRRDGGCCSWPLANGGVCGSKRRLQFDHIVPRARGGLATVENIRLTCREHNVKHARDTFGDAWMARFSRGTSLEKPGGESGSPPPERGRARRVAPS